MTEDTRPREAGPAGADEPQKGLAGKRYSHLTERNRCRFTRLKIKRIDYKDVVTLHKLMTAQGKILSRKRTGIYQFLSALLISAVHLLMRMLVSNGWMF